MAILNSDGYINALIDYYPFGGALSQGGESHLKYTGKEFDEEYDLNLYYYGARYYQPEWGRFISPDPVREYFNPYSYCANDPVNYIDLFGLEIKDPYGQRGWYTWGARITVGAAWVAATSAVGCITGGSGLVLGFANWGHGLAFSTAAAMTAGAFYDKHTKSELDKIGDAFGIGLSSDEGYNDFIDFLGDYGFDVKQMKGLNDDVIRDMINKALKAKPPNSKKQ